VDYLARYAFRIAITNARIVVMDEIHVTFQYKQRDTNEWKACRLTGVEFLRRFLMHVLPKVSRTSEVLTARSGEGQGHEPAL